MIRLGLRLAILAFLLAGLAPVQHATAQTLDEVVESIAPGERGRASALDSEADRQETPAEVDFERWDEDARRAEAILDAGSASTPRLETVRELMADRRSQARYVAEQAAAVLAPLKSEMDALGPAPAEGQSEAESIASQRQKLSQRIAEVEGRMRNADLARARADTLIDRIDRIVRERFAQELLTLGPSPLNPLNWRAALVEAADLNKRLFNEVADALTDPVRSAARMEELPLVLASFAAGLALVFWARNKSIDFLLRRVDGAGRSRLLAIATAALLLRFLVPGVAAVLVILAIRQADITGEVGTALVDRLGISLAALIVARAIGYAYYSPTEPRLRLSALPDAEAARAARLTLSLGVVLFLVFLLVGAGEALQVGPELIAILNFGVVLMGAAAMFGLSRYFAPSDADSEGSASGDQGLLDSDETDAGLARRFHTFGRLGMRVSAVLSVVLSAAGYYAASRYTMVPPIITVGLIGAGLLLHTLIRDAVESVLADRPEAGGATESVSGLRLIPIFAGFVILCLLLPLLALVWGARVADLSEWWGLISDGLTIGEVRISPIDFVTFALVFGLAYSLTRMLQAVLRTSVLPNTRLDIGARSAIISGVGYIGYTVSALVAITTTGVDLSNLAIVAGALSVGIGFGLQNIVSNFVSGIILLVERPVKTGDWIVVGGTHGTVRKIAVRATEIETFDRATLIVPNSDLISGQVTNMTHGSSIGRLIVPVGVAYGSDVRKVEEILKEVASSHALVLRFPSPSVVFQGFGESALEFEIRAYLRDVNYVLSAKSDMNFEIERRFREAGIEIPFAQRDLNIRNVAPIRDLLREVGGGERRAEPRRETVAGPAREAAMPGEGADPTQDAAERPDGEGGGADADGR